MPEAEIQGFIWKIQAGFLSTIQMINQIRIMDHLSNISSIAWIKYAIADSSIMEC
jgi:hypothetical protein